MSKIVGHDQHLKLRRYVKSTRPIDDFTARVIRTILAIPRGRVATYGQIAELAGKPGGARQIGFILRTVVDADQVPWQRVIAAEGRIAFPKRNKNHRLQKRLLEKEGVGFVRDRVDLARHLWRRRPTDARGRPRPRMFGI